MAKDAYKINSLDHEIFYILGKIALALGDRPTAISNFKNSTMKEPNEPAFLELAKIAMTDLEYVQAADLLKESLMYVSIHIVSLLKIPRYTSYWAFAAAKWERSTSPTKISNWHSRRMLRSTTA